jgi:8-oxo-dGTP pyrophosphatase MutT (NUDIX family)
VRAQVVLFQDNQLLMVRLERPGRSFWVLPGGAVEKDESPEEAAAREVLEETGLRIELDRLLLIEQPRTDGAVMFKEPRYTYLARALSDELRPDYREVAEVRWLPVDWPHFDVSTRQTIEQVRQALAGETRNSG